MIMPEQKLSTECVTDVAELARLLRIPAEVAAILYSTGYNRCREDSKEPQVHSAGARFRYDMPKDPPVPPAMGTLTVANAVTKGLFPKSYGIEPGFAMVMARENVRHILDERYGPLLNMPSPTDSVPKDWKPGVVHPRWWRCEKVARSIDRVEEDGGSPLDQKRVTAILRGLVKLLDEGSADV